MRQVPDLELNTHKGVDQRAERVSENNLVVLYFSPPLVESHFECSWYCLELRG